jgi:DNA-binding transcriptional ArsR family regulator
MQKDSAINPSWLDPEHDEATYVATQMHALAHPTRIEIIVLLDLGPSAVTNLAIGLDLPQPAISKHLRVLKEAGLVTAHTEGNARIYSVASPQIAKLVATLGHDLDDLG